MSCFSIFLIALFSVPTGKSNDNLFIVNSTGVGGAYTTIQAAVDAAAAGPDSARVTVLVKPGVYSENVVVQDDDDGSAGDLRIRIIRAPNADAAEIVLDPAAPDQTALVVESTVNSIAIEGMTFSGASRSGQGSPPGPNGLPDTTGSGIVILGCDQASLTGIVSANNDTYGFFGFEVNRIEIEDCQFQGNGVNGIGTISVGSCFVSGATVSENGVAGMGVNARDVVIADSTFMDNGFGLGVFLNRGDGISTINCESVAVRRVLAAGNRLDGLQIFSGAFITGPPVVPSRIDVFSSVFFQNGDDGIGVAVPVENNTALLTVGVISAGNENFGLEVTAVESVATFLSVFTDNDESAMGTDINLQSVLHYFSFLTDGDVVRN